MENNKVNNFFFIVFLAITTIIFWSSAYSTNFNIDDYYIFDHLSKIKNASRGLLELFFIRFDIADYRPISMLSFGLEQYFFGEISPEKSHIINIVLYFILCISIFYTIKKIDHPLSYQIAIFATILFTIHPIHSGVVASIKSRDGILSMLLGVWSTSLFISALNTKKYFYFLLSILLLALASVSKLDALGFGFVNFGLLLFYPIKNKQTFIPLVAALVILVLVYNFRFQIVDIVAPLKNASQSSGTIFTENPIVANVSLSNTISQSITTYWNYILLMFTPHKYYFYYGYDMIPMLSLFSPITIFYLLANICLLLSGLLLIKKTPWYSFGIFIFYTTLLYCSNYFVPVAGIIADRYAFIASLGFCISKSAILVFFIEKYKLTTKLSSIPIINKTPIYIVLLLPIFILAFYFTTNRNNAWEDKISLMNNDLPNLKRSFEANRMGTSVYLNEAMNSTDPSVKSSYFIKGLQCAKNATLLDSSSIYIEESIGIGYFGLGKKNEAKNKMLQVVSKFDTSVAAWDMLGNLYFEAKNYDSAAYCYYQLFRIDPKNEAPYLKFPNALYFGNRADSAISFLKNKEKLLPTYPTINESLSYIYFNQKKEKEGTYEMVVAFKKGKKDYNTQQIIIQKLLSIGDTSTIKELYTLSSTE